MTNHKNRIYSADLIRILAVLGVITIHADAITASLTNYLGGISWWFANLLHSLSSISVPLFAMLSGYLILGKGPRPFRYYLNKSIFRVGIPLLFWSLIYFRWSTIWHGQQYSLFSALLLFFSASVFHLYYLFIIIGLYLSTPMILSAISHSSAKQQKIFFVASLLSSIILLLLQYYVFHIYTIPSAFLIFIPYVSYYFAGYYLGKITLSPAKLKLLIIPIISLILLTALLYFLNIKMFLFGNTFFWTASQGNYFWEHFSPNIVLLSLISFLFLINIKSVSAPRLISLLAGASLGVYLVHPIIIDLVDHYLNYAVHLISTALWFYLIKKILAVYFISALIVLVGSRLPIIKKIFGE